MSLQEDNVSLSQLDMLPTQSLFKCGDDFPSVESQQQVDICCTELYKAGFDEQIIKKCSGHTSDAVRLYKRLLIELEQRENDALQPPRSKLAPPLRHVALPLQKRHPQHC